MLFTPLSTCGLTTSVYWALAAVLVTIITDLRHVNAGPFAIRVAALPHWQGITGNWSTFQVSVGSPGELVELTISTTTSGLGVLGRTGRGENATTFDDGPGFAPESSTSWSGIDPPENLAYKGSDTVRISVINSTAPSMARVWIDVMNQTDRLSPDLGWIGLGSFDDVYNNISVESLISQLQHGVPDSIPSPSYGYTAGASYENGKGVPGSLTLGGYDSVRFPIGPKTPLTLYNRIPEAQVLAIQLVHDGAAAEMPNSNPQVSYTFSAAVDPFTTVMDPSTPYLWFPEAVCDVFAKQFNLTWNGELQLYLFASHSAATEFTDDHSSLFRFSFLGQEADTITISISRLAFALTMKVSNSSGLQELPYFPLKRGRSGNGKFTIGRAFFQEAYLLTDFDKGTFYINRVVFPENPNTNFSIVDIVPLSGAPQGLSRPVTIGLAIGLPFGISLLSVVFCFLWRGRARRQEGNIEANLEKARKTGLITRKAKDEGIAQVSIRAVVMNYWGSDEDLVRDIGLFTPQTGGKRQVQVVLEGPEELSQTTSPRAHRFFDVGGLLGGNTHAVSPPTYAENSEQDPVAGRANSSSQTNTPETPTLVTPCGVDGRIYSGETATSEADSMSTQSVSASDSSVTAPTMRIYKQRAVDSLMTEFKSLLSYGPHVGLSIRAGGRDSGGSSEEAGAGSKHGRDETVASEGSIEDNKVERIKKARLDSSQGPRFACPYYRRNPKKHLRHRACAGPGWTEVRRVKEHVYRTHALPIHCHRCGITMNSDADLRTHQRQPEGCKVRLVDLPEGFDKKQEEELRKKKHGETEEDRWYSMYKILFPDEDGDLVPSPYYQNDNMSDAERQRMDELKQYERFQRRELLRAVRRLLEEAVSGMAGPLEDQLRTQFVGIVRQAQTEVFEAYRGSGDSRKKDTVTTEGKEVSTRRDSVATVTNQELLCQTPTGSHSAPTFHLPTPSSINVNIGEQYPTFYNNAGNGMIDYGNLFLDQAALQTLFEIGSTPLGPTCGVAPNHQPGLDSQAPAIQYPDSGLGQSLTDDNPNNVALFTSLGDPVGTTCNNTRAESSVISGRHRDEFLGRCTVTGHDTDTDPYYGEQGVFGEFPALLGSWDEIFG